MGIAGRDPIFWGRVQPRENFAIDSSVGYRFLLNAVIPVMSMDPVSIFRFHKNPRNGVDGKRIDIQFFVFEQFFRSDSDTDKRGRRILSSPGKWDRAPEMRPNDSDG